MVAGNALSGNALIAFPAPLQVSALSAQAQP